MTPTVVFLTGFTLAFTGVASLVAYMLGAPVSFFVGLWLTALAGYGFNLARFAWLP